MNIEPSELLISMMKKLKQKHPNVTFNINLTSGLTLYDVTIDDFEGGVLCGVMEDMAIMIIGEHISTVVVFPEGQD